MDKLCWACTEPYGDSLGNCPQCGASKEAPVRKPEVKKVTVTKLKGKK